jgi:hypothetical protein
MPVVSITRLRVRSWRYLPSFLLYAFRSARQATKADGNLAVQVLNDHSKTFWTATTWTTDAAMKKFMLAGAHGQAMRKLLDWCDEAALVHWPQENNDLPTWPEACRRLQSEGRRSKVNHPSPAHIAYQFPEPSARRGIRLK